MRENPEENNYGSDDFSSNDFSIDGLKKNLIETNNQLLENLKNRYMQELLGSMIFFVFNEICQSKNNYSENTLDKKNPTADMFLSFWSKEVRKKAKKEMLDINDKLKHSKMNFLGAISNFSLPSTEDYQLIYNQAISEIEKVFQKNTKI
jgi:hypothetical protein